MIKIKIAAATPRVYLGNVAKNLQEVSDLVKEAASRGAEMIVFPPHPLTGATCGSLFSEI